MSDSTAEKSLIIPIPLVAPIGWEIDDVKLVQEVWDTFVKPDQEAGNVQSGEMRMLMAILRAVADGLETKATTTTEWGVRRDADSAIWSEAAARETLQRQRKHKLKTFLIKRQVGPWELAES
ncbi:hypothetical protein ACVWY0_003210 [Arthrobacter sp. UYNi723]